MSFSWNQVIVLSIVFLGAGKARSDEGMPAMPVQKFKKEFVIRSREDGEALLESRGYGDKEPEVRMMNLMMVEGSGMEGMEMSSMPEPSPVKTPATYPHAENPSGSIELVKGPPAPKVGANLFQFSSPVKPTAEVFMTSMNMGTENPKVKEVKPGIYELKAHFAMAGPWAIRIKTPQGEKVFDVQVSR